MLRRQKAEDSPAGCQWIMCVGCAPGEMAWELGFDAGRNVYLHEKKRISRVVSCINLQILEFCPCINKMG